MGVFRDGEKDEMTTRVATGDAEGLTPAATKWVYDFAEGSREMRELLGGKGSGIAEMTRILGPELVPAGFTITTQACVAYMRAGETLPAGLEDQVGAALAALEDRAGKRLGDAEDPLLVSVRSGARESMPGMMDSVLNLGPNDESAAGLAARTGDERFAWDCYRRLVQMFRNVVRGVAGERFEDEIARVKREHEVTLDAAALRDLTESFKSFFDFPTEPRQQLTEAISAVSTRGWATGLCSIGGSTASPTTGGRPSMSSRWCTATGATLPAPGVAFSRDEVTGGPQPSGDFLPAAQGEDVVSGVRTPRDLSELRDWMAPVADQLTEILRKLEGHYKDMQDTEFTVEEGRLFMLQTRNAKRPAQAGRALCGGCLRGTTVDEIGGDRDDRRGITRRPSASFVRPDGALHGDRTWRRRLTGRREGRDCVHGRGGGRASGGRSRCDSRAAVHGGR